MSLTRGLVAEQLYPASKQLISTIVAKGWIERQPDGQTYCLTPAGEEALRATSRRTDEFSTAATTDTAAEMARQKKKSRMIG